MFPLPEVPLPSAVQLDRARAELLRDLGSRVLTGDDEVESYRRDDSGIDGRLPCAVVLVESAQDLITALTVAERTGVPITPRAGGSGRTGGAVPVAGGIVLATQGYDDLVDFDRQEGRVVVQPGMNLEALHRLVEAEGWFYPPDPNSAALCCLGGNVAENAAGPRAFKYGPTRNYVLGVDAYLPGGQRFFAGRRTRKGVTGYDVLGLLVGSEGTLAAFGEIVLSLVPKPESVMTLLGLFRTSADSARAVQEVVSQRLLPRCLEFLDGTTLDVMRQSGVALRPDAGSLLIVEIDGDAASCEAQAQRVGEALDAAGALEVSVATSEDARKRLWQSRKQMSHAVRTRSRHKISEDVVVPRARLLELLEEVRIIGETERVETLCYGHAGDGNLHVNFLWNDADDEPRVTSGVRRLFESTVRLGGTLSGEHGIGILKAPYLPLEQSQELIELQRRLKAAFDPRGLLNPGKVLPPGGHGPC
ncbi:MAG TPA: FAD-linked oxidase C-terminal domain-containing protein [Polyangiaceae bacterium]|nr:FAD-linked oxidase C-terminal domain-containing protein [Polyangiaceae bacterium]